MTSRRPFITAAALAATAVMAAAGAVFAPASDARAQVAAKVESQTRPNFGILLDPPVRAHRGGRAHHRRYDYRRHRPDWRPGWGGGAGGQEVVLVDCGGNPGSGAVEDAVRRVRPGGTLIIRARGGPCVGWLNVDKPLTIIGEGGFDPRDWSRNPTPTLQAPDGLPCLTVAQGVRVEIRDVIFASPRAGDAACIVGYGAEIVMNRVGFRHAGDEAAIFADGGLLDIRNTVIDARTVAPAIVADGAALTAYEMVVTGAQSGLELIPGAPVSTLSAVTLIGGETPNNFGPRAIGVIVRSARDYGRVEITNTKICGYVEGVAVEGASVSISGSRICKADKGAVLYNGELTLTDSRIRARSIGVAAASGRAVVTDNVFAGVRDVIYREERAVVDARNNRVWSRNDICRPRFNARYQDRYAPEWQSRPTDGYACQTSSYPQDWWSQEEGSLGQPYQDDAYALDGYDRFEDGYGWYSRDGGYVDDDRFYGDDRWTRSRPRRR
jgi:hypothetical protein